MERERVIVKFPYPAENADELNIEKGDIITVIDKNLEDEGWWKGELNGRVGVFPDNFVEPLPPSAVAQLAKEEKVSVSLSLSRSPPPNSTPCLRRESPAVRCRRCPPTSPRPQVS